MEKYKKDSILGVIACNVIGPKKNLIAKENDFYTDRFRGGAFAIKRKVLEEVGYFPIDYFRQGEEMDLSLRIIDKGYSIVFCEKAFVYNERTEVNRNDKLFMFYSSRNDILTVIKRYPFYLMPFGVLWKILV